MRDSKMQKIINENMELKAKVFQLENLNNDFIQKNKDLLCILSKREQELNEFIKMNKDLVQQNKDLLELNKKLTKEQKGFIKILKKSVRKYV